MTAYGFSVMTDKRKSALPGFITRETAPLVQEASGFVRKSEHEQVATITDADFRVGPLNPEVEQRSVRLREAVRAAGGNKAVSAKSGVPSSTLHAYLTGQDWKVSAAVALASACNVSLNWLAVGEGAPHQEDAQPLSVETLEHGGVVSPRADIPPNLVLIPRYDVHASAGSGSVVDQEQLIGMMAFDELFLRRQVGVRSEGLVTVEATGDSMEPTIRDGDLLLVDSNENDIRDGRIYVLNVHGFAVSEANSGQYGRLTSHLL